ncbi:MAG: ABC transporter permease subunit [Clostridia bacterium]|nr:ABC transporter permease subunit [Clostridia bacterium]
MKKFVNLVKNESLKLWGQKSFRVLLIIIGIILVLTPFSSVAMNSALGSFEYEELTHEDYRQKAEEARAAGEELEARECEVYYEVELYFAEKGLASSSVEYSLYYLDLLDLSLARSTLVILSEGEYTAENLRSSYYSSLDELYVFLTDYGFYDDMGTNGYMQYNVFEIVLTALEDKSAEDWIKAIDSELDSIRFNIEHFSMKSYYDRMKTFAQDSVKALEAGKAQSLELIKNSNLPESERNYHQALISYYADAILCYGTYETGVDYLIENNCEYASWEYNTVDAILYSAAYSCEYSFPLTSDEFSSDYLSYQYNSVEDYNEEMQNERLLAIEAQEYALCSLSNSIPMPATLPDISTKATVISQFRTFAGMLAVLFICYSGVMMAHEYTNGTIRLLLIKPRSRKRILCSKFVSMTFWWLIIAASAMILLTLENMLILGVNDLFVPDLKAVGKGIAMIPSFVSALGVFGEEFVLAMLYVAFATLFAVLTKKTVLSVVFPMLVSIGAETAQGIAIALYDAGATFLAYTPFFYLDFGFLHVTAPDCFTYTYGFSDLVASTYASTNIILGKHANIWIGIAMIAAITVLVALWALRAFRKQKI